MAEKDWQILVPKSGGVSVAAYPTITEKEIEDDRSLLVVQLHGAYEGLVEYMLPFQKEWDSGPLLSIARSVRQGAGDGASAWSDDFQDMFKKETWVELGGKVKSMAGSAIDAGFDYASKTTQDIVAKANETYSKVQRIADSQDKTLRSWGWWAAQIEHVEKTYEAELQLYAKTVNEAVETTKEMVEKAKKFYAHRQAILGAPELIASGDIKGVQSFVDTVVKDIDPALAKEIKNNPNFYAVLEVISDHDSAVTFMAYVGLMMEAVPPNFLAYVAGKGTMYVLIEVVMMIISALLTAGAAVAARVAALVARLAMSSVKVAQAARKIENAQLALDAFIRMIETLCDAANRLQDLGEKLVVARLKGLRLQGKTQQKLEAKRSLIKRDIRCRRCGSSAHRTPRGPRGIVVYR